VLRGAGEDRRTLDHPGDRPPEVAEQFFEGIDPVLRDRVLTELFEASLRLGAAQSGRAAGCLFRSACRRILL